jgi:hypothetical protein
VRESDFRHGCYHRNATIRASRPETCDLAAETCRKKPTHWAVWRAENEPVSDGGNAPRPIRLFRMAEHSTPDLFASRVPVHSSLVQKSVATITNLAGRLPPWMLGNREHFRKGKMQNSWQEACWQECSCGDGRLASLPFFAEAPSAAEGEAEGSKPSAPGPPTSPVLAWRGGELGSLPAATATVICDGR